MTARFPDNTPIPGTSFTVSTDEKLREGLALAKQDKGYWPTEDTMQVAHSVVSYWAPELVIVNEDLTEILLTLYETDDPRLAIFKDKWHMPGGYNRWAESYGMTCERIAKREVKLNVFGDEFRTLGTYKWQHISEDPVNGHPYGRPLSVYTWVTTKEKIAETPTCRFFPFAALPSPLVGGAHQYFLDHSHHYMKILRVIRGDFE